MTRLSRSTWMGAAALSPEQREQLLGSGAPFEIVEEPVLGEPMEVFLRRPRSLRAMFDEVTAGIGDLPFLVRGDESVSYGEAAELIDRTAAVLAGRHGIGPGDRVAIVSANSPAYAIAMWATVSMGAIVTSLNGWWAGDELAFGIGLAGPSILLGDEPRLERVPEGAVPAGVPVVTLDDLIAEARATTDAPPAAAIDEDDPAFILFTSGTTGRPKGATLTHRNVLVLSMTARLGRAMAGVMSSAPPGGAPAGGAAARQPASILSSPMFHISGLAGTFASGPCFGTKLVFAPPGRWDPLVHLQMTVEHGVTSWSGVPTQYARMLHHPDFDSFDLRRVRNASSGGAVFPPELVHELGQKMPWLTLGNGYGMTETNGLGTLNAGPGIRMFPDSVGPAQATVEVEIRDDTGAVAPQGEVGEIHIRSASVFLRYWNDPKATAEALDEHRWYRTGDYGRIVDGFLHLDSRIRDLIIRGGENVYPIEIENRLVEHPLIDDAAVIGVEHPELGQEVKAFVVLAPGAELDAAEVQAWVAESLARFKVPSHVAFLDALPYTESGKVVKAELERREREA